jgi:hypothetical protein
MEGLINLFKLSENIIPISLIAIGYAAEKKLDTERFLPERIHFNKW